jgi:MTH538 TIR-like domain (DUF1863)
MDDRKDIWRLLRPSPLGPGGGASDLFRAYPPQGALPLVGTSTLLGLAGLGPDTLGNDWLSDYARRTATKRKVYFAFRYSDIMRVNNVRMSGTIGHDQEKNPRDFYDRSIWEKREINDPESLKRLMREGVEHASVVCVLTGTNTYDSRWVKYEIARAVVDNRGLLNVDINALPHHITRRADSASVNPLSVMGLYHDHKGQFSLWEQVLRLVDQMTFKYEWFWRPYVDYTYSVSLPSYLTAPSVGYIRPLSAGTASYDYVRDGGRRNIGQWLDTAALGVGR